MHSAHLTSTLSIFFFIALCVPSLTFSLPVVENTPLIGQHAPAGVVVMPPLSTQPVFKEFPVDMVDDKGNRFTTETRYTSGLLTWVAVGITCLVAGTYNI